MIEYKFKTKNKQTKEWLSQLIDTLDKELDEIPQSYYMQLDLLSDALDLYEEAKAEIHKNGIMVKDSRGGTVKSPAISVLNSTQLFISKLMTQFALTRMAKSKLKDNKATVDLQDYISSLTE